MHVWSTPEIQSLADFGSDDIGWFYGLVRDRWRLRLAEIYPGLGYATAWPIRSVEEVRWVVRDVLARGPHTQQGKS